jgi:uncharacterized protein (TIGR03437 family)
MQTNDAPQGSGSLLAASASILRFLQNNGDIPLTNGSADPTILHQFLNSLCQFDSQGVQYCDGFLSPPDSSDQVMNLWRLANFAGNGIDISVEKTDQTSIRDLVGATSPVLLTLAMNANGVAAGSHSLAAIGVSGDGTILIHDPNPAYARGTLTDYLNGFTTVNGTFKGTVSSAVRLLPRTPAAGGFLVTTRNPAVSITSQAGDCGKPVQWALTDGVSFVQRYCDGAQPAYQIDLTNDGVVDATVTDLGSQGGRVKLSGGGGVASFKVVRPGAQLVVTSQDAGISARGVVNAATFTYDMAPGGIVAIFGNGLARQDFVTKVEVAGQPASVLLATPFQVNAQLPPDIGAGSVVVRLTTPYGVVEQSIDIQTTAPAVFRINSSLSGENRGATLNQDGKLNLRTNPARRGSIVTLFGTGFGTVAASGGLFRTTVPVTGVLGGQESAVTYAGLAPGFIGLYQVNFPIPQAAAPGLDQTLSFRQGGVESTPVLISIQ